MDPFDLIKDILETKAREPRDADNDGWVNEGTPYRRPATPRIPKVRSISEVRRPRPSRSAPPIGSVMAINKDTKKLLKVLEKEGWRVVYRSGGHITAYPPDKSIPGVTMASTPSDRRAWDNMLAQLRRSGYKDR